MFLLLITWRFISKILWTLHIKDCRLCCCPSEFERKDVEQWKKTYILKIFESPWNRVRSCLVVLLTKKTCYSGRSEVYEFGFVGPLDQSNSNNLTMNGGLCPRVNRLMSCLFDWQPASPSNNHPSFQVMCLWRRLKRNNPKNKKQATAIIQ